MPKPRRSGKSSESQPPAGPPGNKLLAALPPAEYRRLQPLIGRTVLRQGQVLHATGERFQAVYFPLGGLCSMVATMEDGRMVEVATVGNEGMTGVSAIFGGRYPAGEVIAQLPGTSADVMPIDLFAAEMRRRGPLFDILCRYASVVISVLVQSAACNGLHSAEERSARWLLHTRDRTGSDTFPLTHELLAVVLGVRRATVTAVVNNFQRQALVEFGRRRITVLDRAGLGSIACECYTVIKNLFGRIS